MAMNEPHPFDGAFEMLRKLRSDLQDLRAAFTAEQQQRACEVNELKQEVSMLRDALAREKGERQAQCHKLTTDFTTETSARAKALDEMKVLHRQQLGQLNAMLQDEIRDRKASEHVRETRETALASERKGESDAIHQDLTTFKHNFLACKDDHACRLNNIAHDVDVVVSYLMKVSSSWESLKGTKMLSTNKTTAGSHSDLGGATSSPRHYSMSSA
mmetsp:Transcript_133394/g.333024  ORF Transcript_133394/g.333024 Transcript_133394/m.333024 type:complete len:215 (-) Transcript_133394:102-746(-)